MQRARVLENFPSIAAEDQILANKTNAMRRSRLKIKMENKIL